MASAFAIALTWLLQAAVGRILGPASYAAFMVVWGLLFLEIGLLLGLQQEVTRAVASRGESEHPELGPHPSVLHLGLVIGVAGTLLSLVSAPAWGPSLFGAHWLPVTLATAFGFVAYSLSNAVNGVLAAQKRWTDYAISIFTDAALRLALVLPVALLRVGLHWQTWALDGAALSWIVLLGRSGFRSAVRWRICASLRTLSAGAIHAMVATGCSALMVAGFPVLLKVTASGPLGSEGGVIVAAVIATRAPLLLPLTAFQAVVLTHFVLARDRVGPTLVRLLSAVGATTLVGMVAGYVAGPWLLTLLYGSRFRIDPGLLAALVFGAGLMAMQMLTGSAVMAFNRQRMYAAGWLISAAVAVVVLATGLPLGDRTALALILGPSVGVAINSAALLAHDRK